MSTSQAMGELILLIPRRMRTQKLLSREPGHASACPVPDQMSRVYGEKKTFFSRSHFLSFGMPITTSVGKALLSRS